MQPVCNHSHKLNQGQPSGRRDPCRLTSKNSGQSIQGDVTLPAAHQRLATTQLCMENQGANQDLDVEEIIKSAREAASTRSKDRILKQIRGGGTSEEPTQEEHTEDRSRDTARDEVETQGVKQVAAERKQRRQKRGEERGKRILSGRGPRSKQASEAEQR
ncbi:hypothetical protein NDU88_007038 [Pleurodeles waltl]|uniref:Uncharacterized protein n=1 Tax=Pleurodeles waltl TaxID=8319 RepID=A0AAV7QQP5_PLEWA|nr:hypothetical protein NDU88_007038 [Pleurodeles waltl]